MKAGPVVELTNVTTVVNPYDCSADNAACGDDLLWEVNGTIVVFDRAYQDADWSARSRSPRRCRPTESRSSATSTR